MFTGRLGSFKNREFACLPRSWMWRQGLRCGNGRQAEQVRMEKLRSRSAGTDSGSPAGTRRAAGSPADTGRTADCCGF